MLRRDHKAIRGTIDYYVKHKIPFVLEIQNETLTIKCKRGNCTTKSATYTIDELNFIKSVKQYIVKNNLQLKYLSKYGVDKEHRKKIVYYKYNGRINPGMKFQQCINIDLNSAYWETAFKLGLLSDILYQKGLDTEKISKQARLAAIGSLAKKRRIYEYDGEKQFLREKKTSDQTEHLWDVICDHVGKVLVSAAKACGNDFLFFWVDGIYIKNSKEAAKKVYQVFNNHGFEYKTIHLQQIEITDKHILVTGKDKDGKIKPFPFRNKATQEKFKGYNTDL